MTDDTTFFNTYMQVLKAKFDRVMADSINIETQLIVANQKIEEQNKQIEDLQKNINKLEKKISSQ
jgi:predicted  nucleic acid-binding Zn-ribbon protein